MKILVTGASGLIGSALVRSLAGRGDTVIKLARRTPGDGATGAWWEPDRGRIEIGNEGRIDGVVHLAGESIAQRWTAAARERIRDSRVNGTRLVCEALADLESPPGVLVCASATGFYGDRGDEWLDETSAPGQGFLAGVSQEWEAAAAPAVARGIRVVHLRFGIVLAREGGALKKMLPAFRLGAGGKLGDGRAYWSWIALEDAVAAIEHALGTESLKGPVNAVAPNPETNAGFTKALGKALGRPTIFAMPRFAVELLFGEMGREALLASFRVKPAKLLASGFKFRFPTLDATLRHALES